MVDAGQGINGAGKVNDGPVILPFKAKDAKPQAQGSGKAGINNPAAGALGQVIVASAAHDQKGNPISREGISNLFDAVTVVDTITNEIAPKATEKEQLRIFDAIDSSELTPEQEPGSTQQILIGAHEAPSSDGIGNLLQKLSQPIDVGIGLPERATADEHQLMADVLSEFDFGSDSSQSRAA